MGGVEKRPRDASALLLARRLSRRMSSVEDRYYKLNRAMLKVLGLWPYQNSKWTYVQITTVTIIYLTAMFVQVIGRSFQLV